MSKIDEAKEPFSLKSFTKKQRELLELLKEGYELHRDMAYIGDWSLHNPNGEGMGTHVNVSSAVKLWKLDMLKLFSMKFPTEKYRLEEKFK